MTAHAKRRMPVTGMIGSSLFFSGVTYAATLPYGAVVGIEVLHISDSMYAALLMVSSLIGAATSVILGYISDRVSDRRLLVIASALMGAMAHGLIFFGRSQATFFFAVAVLLPFGYALFGQTFSFARTFYNLRQPERAEFMVSALRTIFAIAWVVVPPVAGWVAATYSAFDVYGISACAYLLCALTFFAMMRDERTRIGVDSKADDGRVADAPDNHIELPILLGIGSLTAIKVAVVMQMIATPLFIVTVLGETLAEVGIFAGLAALLEVPFILLWGMTIAKMPKHWIIAINAVIYALYLYLLSNVTTFSGLLWLQGLNAIATAALMSIPISYMQEAIRGRVGLSTSLHDVVGVVSQLIAAGLFAAIVVQADYGSVFFYAAIISAIGAVLLVAVHSVPSRNKRAVS